MKTRLTITLLIITLCFNLHSQSEVKIQTQTWSSENLSTTTFNNGDQIPHAQTEADWIKASKSKTPAWCYYKNDKSNIKEYGVLYNWYAVVDKRGLSPKGWRIPTQQDASKLLEALGNKAAEKIKSKSGWTDNQNGTNSVGFNAKPAGIRAFTATFREMGYTAAFWTSTPVEPAYLNSAASFYVKSYQDEVKAGNSVKGSGFSVRLIKD